MVTLRQSVQLFREYLSEYATFQFHIWNYINDW